jgi:hypothetical protein
MLSSVVSQCGGDVGVAGQAEQADRGVAQGRHDLGSAVGADLGVVPAVGDVADPVQPVFDVPVPVQPVGDLVGGGVGGRQRYDGIESPDRCRAAASSAARRSRRRLW